MAKIITGIALIAAAVAFVVVMNPWAVAIVWEIAVAVGSMGASLTISGVVQALYRAPGTSISARQAAAPWMIIYGQQRVGGIIIYQSTTGSNQDYLNLVIVWAAHSCRSIDALYIDGRKVYFSGGANWGNADGSFHTDDNGNSYRFGGKLYAEHMLGDSSNLTSAGTSWFSSLNAVDPHWTSDCTGYGLCMTYLRLQSGSAWPNGIPGIKATLKGKNDIYDPRTASRNYSTNWALCVNDILCDPRIGLRCNYATEVDEPQLIAAANICDEAVPLAAGGSEPRYTCNGCFTTDSAPGETLATMMNAAMGRLSYIGGVWKIYPAAWYGSTLSYGAGDLISNPKWSPARKYRELCNAVKGQFTCPVFPYIPYFGAGVDPDAPNAAPGIFNGKWQPTDYPAYRQDANHGYTSGDVWYLEDGSITLWADVQQQFVISVATAQRLAKIHLLRNRWQGTGSLAMNMSAYRAQAQEVIQFTFPYLQFTAKYLEVTDFRFVLKMPGSGADSSGQDAPVMYCELDVAETDPSIYSWSPSTEELTLQDGTPPLQYDGTQVAPPTSVALSSGTSAAVVGTDGVVIPRIHVTWTPPADLWVQDGGWIEMQYQLVPGSGPAGPWLSVQSANGAATDAFIASVVSGQSYNVQLRSARPSGAVSIWVVVGPYTVGSVSSTIGNSTIIPSNPLTATALSAGGGQISCAAFQNIVGTTTTSCTAANTITSGLVQGQLYYVYYNDPTLAGGAVTIIATQNQSDYLGVAGAYLIAAVAIPTYGLSVYRPTSALDQGSSGTNSAGNAFDLDPNTYATVSGSDDGTHTPNGQCLFSGFPVGAVTGRTLVVRAGANRIGGSGTVSMTIQVSFNAGVGVTTIATLTASTATANYSISVPSGTDLSQVRVTATADATYGGTGATLLALLHVYDIKVQ